MYKFAKISMTLIGTVLFLIVLQACSGSNNELDTNNSTGGSGSTGAGNGSSGTGSTSASNTEPSPAPAPVCSGPPTAGTSGYAQIYKACVAGVDKYYEKTECVKDQTTGLVWEGKTPGNADFRGGNVFPYSATGPFSGLPYPNGYPDAVNGVSLCGYTDWRLPTAAELLTLFKQTTFPCVDENWFPNTANINTSSYYLASGGSAVAPRVSFGQCINQPIGNGTINRVRLVRP
ncbi:MAG TPA: DUF1566 domain-containing protein [Burkholderiaceae bacterium]|nr:DUF1566 domain-containing protein [Burkholderiaceae bacterium]